MLCRLSGERGTAPHGSGHVGSIPLLAALATRLEQATAAEAIIRRAGYPNRCCTAPRRRNVLRIPEPGH